MLEYGELRIFKYLIEEGGFSKAATKLRLSQSAVSQAVSNLESKLEASLLLRGKNQQMTPAGRRVFDYACRMLTEEEAVLEEIDRIRRGETAELSLAVNSTINRYHAPPLLKRFCQTHDGTRIKVKELPSRSIIYDVVSGKMELGFGPFQSNMSPFETFPIFKENRLLVVSPAHVQFDSLKRGGSQALKGATLISSFLDDPELRPSNDRLRDSFHSIWQVSSLNLRVELVGEGFGVTFVNERVLREHPASKDFHVVEKLPFRKIERQVGLFWKRGHRLSEAGAKFLICCREHWELNKG